MGNGFTRVPWVGRSGSRERSGRTKEERAEFERVNVDLRLQMVHCEDAVEWFGCRDLLFSRNRPLGYWVLDHVRGRYSPVVWAEHGDDIYQEVFSALLRACELWNPGISMFSTYGVSAMWHADARHWLRSDRYGHNGVGMRSRLDRLMGVYHELAHEIGYWPSVDEVCERGGFDMKWVDNLNAFSRAVSQYYTKDGLKGEWVYNSDFVEGGEEVPTVFPDEFVRVLRERVSVLLPREREVFRMRCDGLTLKMVGEVLGVTRERARQVEKKGWERLLGSDRGRSGEVLVGEDVPLLPVELYEGIFRGFEW